MVSAVEAAGPPRLSYWRMEVAIIPYRQKLMMRLSKRSKLNLRILTRNLGAGLRTDQGSSLRDTAKEMERLVTFLIHSFKREQVGFRHVLSHF